MNYFIDEVNEPLALDTSLEIPTMSHVYALPINVSQLFLTVKALSNVIRAIGKHIRG